MQKIFWKKKKKKKKKKEKEKKKKKKKKKKKTKRNNSNTKKKKKSCLLNNSLFQSVDTALTKYSTLRIVHIGRTEEGGKTCGPGFPSQVWIGSRYLSREKKRKKKRKATLKDNTLGRLFFPPL